MLSWLTLFVPMAAAQSWSNVAPGVDTAQWTTGDPLRISALRVSLCTQGVRIRATTSGERGQKTSTWASATAGVVGAVNGGFYTSGYAPDGGRAMGGGVEWSDSTDTDYRGFLGFGEHQLAHSPSSDVAALEAWMEEAVNGDATLVQAGSAVDCGGCGSGKHPRTAVGFSEDQQTLYMVAVDGRSGSSEGITIDDLAIVMRDIGAHQAMNLDGGGSTTIWRTGAGVFNVPSDGSERTVANHLGVISTGDGVQYNCPVGWHATWGSLDFDGAEGTTLTAPAGSLVTGAIHLTNSGTHTWDTENTRLAPLPRDVASPFAADDWIAPHRITAVEAATAPGEVGTFRFAFQMPQEVGTSTRFEFTLLQELTSWFDDSWGPEDGSWYLTIVTSEPEPPDSGDGGSDADSGDDGGDGGDGDAGTGGAGDDGASSDGGPDSPAPDRDTAQSGGCSAAGNRPALPFWALPWAWLAWRMRRQQTSDS